MVTICKNHFYCNGRAQAFEIKVDAKTMFIGVPDNAPIQIYMQEFLTAYNIVKEEYPQNGEWSCVSLAANLCGYKARFALQKAYID